MSGGASLGMDSVIVFQCADTQTHEGSTMGHYTFRRDKAVARPMPATTPCDWRTSRPHLHLLSLYLEPNNFLDATRRDWDGALGEPPDAALERFVAEGILAPVGQGKRLVRGLPVEDLKRELMARGLFTGGKKPILVERLAAADPDYVKAMTPISGPMSSEKSTPNDLRWQSISFSCKPYCCR